MYNIEEEIIHFIFQLFKGLERKKENIDLVFHSVMVGNMLKSINCDQNTVFIGYLHDVIEDTNCTYETLLDKYGKGIADGVLYLSEDQSILEYKDRKRKFINNLRNVDDDILIVEVADKLQNLISDYNLFLKDGKDSLITECNNFEELRWYYLELKILFNSRIKNNPLLDRYNRIIDIYFK